MRTVTVDKWSQWKNGIKHSMTKTTTTEGFKQTVAIGILQGRKRLKTRKDPTTIKLEGLNEAIADFPLFTLMG